VALAIFNMFQDGTVSWGTLFAAYVLASLPLLLLFFATSNAFIRGLSAGAVKN
jgi:ABC-type glycerol-3-phosphate transport system permease component